MGWRLGLWMRTAVEVAIFRKVLRMPLSAFVESGEEAALSGGNGGGGKGGKKQQGSSQVEEEGTVDDEEEEEEEDGEGGEMAAEAEKEKEDDAYYHNLSITPGLIMNMATSDVDRFQRLGSLIHYLIFAPLDIAVVSACGVRQTGPSFLIGIDSPALFRSVDRRLILLLLLLLFST